MTWGVVTMMAPTPAVSFMYCARVMCSSDVPGGASTTRYSSSPQSTSFRNCLISPFFLTPRQITASFLDGIMKPMLITHKESSTHTGCQPEAAWEEQTRINLSYTR